MNVSAFGYLAIVDQIANGAEDVVLYKRDHHKVQPTKLSQFESALQ